MLKFAIKVAVMVACGTAAAAECPFEPFPSESASGVLSQRRLMIRRTEPKAIVVRTKLERDDDGGPNAYHIGFKGTSVDPGLDHICNGASVLEYDTGSGKLVDKYREGGSIGSLQGIDQASTWSRTALCKQDYIALRDAGFPACGPGNLCMLWYGIASTKISCGYPGATHGPADDRCGIPIRQKVAGVERPYYLTTTTLRRPGSQVADAVQTDYANAAVLPFVVMPGGQSLPEGMPWKIGDLALVVWRTNIIAAVVGDTGPSQKFGEASRALLRALHDGRSSSTIGDGDPASVIFVAGSDGTLLSKWPIDPKDLKKQGRSLLARLGGRGSIGACADIGMRD
ncbi:hypothetical protein IVB41_12480 [Bradyrhizobium sp. 44]|uniref:glycoside hydrolase family 75 protein n=1 Tax=Bradyrhizobium sp. 44 TaxID=2782675 RepID=UPI001FF946AA|nr:glycoside hydrolase family 75 protein [Bradyrhizobium sp. 44]MCK1284732.1 hypothetical protein [Bradyrhizobium sp. 44]